MNTAEMLESEGMIVIETGTAQEALEAMKSGATHILIADVGLPDMSGFDLAVKLRESSPTLPVIFATGHNDVPGADAMPFCAVVPKPYDIAQIKRQIEALVVSGRLHGRNG